MMMMNLIVEDIYNNMNFTTCVAILLLNFFFPQYKLKMLSKNDYEKNAIKQMKITYSNIIR